MKVNPIGIVQGRLTRSPPGQLQWFPQEEWENEFPIAGEIGLSFVELIAEREHNPRNPLWTDEGCARIRELNASSRLIPYSFCSDYIIDHSCHSKEVLDKTLELIDRGKLLGMKKFILPFFEKSEITAENRSGFVDFIQRCADAAGAAGMGISLETMLGAEDFLGLIDDVGRSNVKCVFDTGNRITSGKDIYAEIRALGSVIDHVHLKDKTFSGSNVLFGTGEVDFFKVFEALRDIGFNRSYTFETHRGNDPTRTCQFHMQFVDFFAQEVEGGVSR